MQATDRPTLDNIAQALFNCVANASDNDQQALADALYAYKNMYGGSYKLMQRGSKFNALTVAALEEALGMNGYYNVQ